MKILNDLLEKVPLEAILSAISLLLTLIPIGIHTYISSKILSTFEKAHLPYKKRARLTTYNSISYVLILGILYYFYILIIDIKLATFFFAAFISFIMIILLRILKNKYIKVYYAYDQNNIILSKFDKDFYSIKNTNDNSFQMVKISDITSKTFTKKYYLPPKEKKKMEKKLKKWEEKESLNYKTNAKMKRYKEYLQNEIELP